MLNVVDLLFFYLPSVHTCACDAPYLYLDHQSDMKLFNNIFATLFFLLSEWVLHKFPDTSTIMQLVCCV